MSQPEVISAVMEILRQLREMGVDAELELKYESILEDLRTFDYNL